MIKFRQVGMALAAGALLGAASLAWAQESVRLSNGVSGNGELTVNPDAYGSVTYWTTNWTNDDFYDPRGSLGRNRYSFASSIFMFIPGQSLRASFGSAGRDIRNTYPGNIGVGILSPLVAFDSDGNGVNDSANSSFWALGTSVTFDLFQNVGQPDANSVATYTKCFNITNTGQTPITFLLLQHDDYDILFDGAATDPAGTDSTGGVRNPYMREPDSFAGHLDTEAALSGTPGYDYVAGRSGFDPDGTGPDPAMGYGSDFQIWNNYGLPNSWKNYTAGIGYNMDGILGQAMPPGGLPPHDAFMSLQWEISLNPGECTTIQVVHTYGDSVPNGRAVSCPACGGCDPCDANCDGAVDAFDIEPFIDVLVNPNPMPCSSCAGDANGDMVVDAFDIEPFINCLVGP